MLFLLFVTAVFLLPFFSSAVVVVMANNQKKMPKKKIYTTNFTKTKLPGKVFLWLKVRQEQKISDRK